MVIFIFAWLNVHYFGKQFQSIETFHLYSIRKFQNSFIVCRLLPESVPWLAANGREEEAELILRKAARINKVTLPEHILKRESEDDHQVAADNDNQSAAHDDAKGDKHTLVNSVDGKCLHLWTQ